MRYLTVLGFIIFASPAFGDQCADLEQEYSRYDADRARFEISGFSDNSALRSENRLSAILVILQRQSIVLDLIIARDCPLPDPPRPFSSVGVICQGSPRNCRD